jgi:hypothetical protein
MAVHPTPGPEEHRESLVVDGEREYSDAVRNVAGTAFGRDPP